MVKPRAKLRVKRRHTGRNLSILAIVVAVVVIVIAVSGSLIQQVPTSFPLFVHVYDKNKAPTWQDVTRQDQLVLNVTVSVSGPNGVGFTHVAPYGIIAGPDPFPAGTYNVTVTKAGFSPNFVLYALGPNCADKTPDGNCHVYIPMSETRTF